MKKHWWRVPVYFNVLAYKDVLAEDCWEAQREVMDMDNAEIFDADMIPVSELGIDLDFMESTTEDEFENVDNEYEEAER